MWIAQISLKHEGDLFTEKTEKFHVNFYAYPMTNYRKNKKYLFVVMGILEGEEENKKAFIKELKKDKRIIKLDVNGEAITLLIEYPLKEVSAAKLEVFYNPSLIHIEPVLNSYDGFEYWKVASFEKEDLDLLIKTSEEKHKGKLISLHETKINNFSLINITPKISSKQKEVIKTALEKGYYEYPRKIEIKQLAKSVGVSYSTCQEHLRKAEINILKDSIKKL